MENLKFGKLFIIYIGIILVVGSTRFVIQVYKNKLDTFHPNYYFLQHLYLITFIFMTNLTYKSHYNYYT